MHGLNPPQRAAVEACDGPVLVLAGAGSGKTRVIIEKVAHLVERGRYPARRIAAITFTNKAAREMRQRAGKRLRGQHDDLTVCTFHALGLKIAQSEHAKLGLRRGFSVFDADDSFGLLRDLLPAGSKPDAVRAVQALISQAKSSGLDPAAAAAAARSAREHDAAALYARYQQRLAAFNAVDFDDLIRRPVDLLEQDAEARAAWRERIGYLLVDECQDSNDAQYRLLKALSGAHGQFTCVGDDDQSIYAWRGANPGNLQRMAEDYPALQVITLEQNYRCPQRVLRVANALIAKNPHAHLKTLWSANSEGERIRVRVAADAVAEAAFVADQIHWLHLAKNVPFGECAVLFRGNHQSRPLEQALQRVQIPYHLTGGTAFLDRGEVKDALAWLRLLANPDDDAAFLHAVQAPKREIGATTLAKLGELAQSAGVPLARAAERHGVLAALPARSGNALLTFLDLLEQLRREAAALAPPDLLRRVVAASGLAAALRAECRDEAQFQRRNGHLEALADWLDLPAHGPGTHGAGALAAALTLLAHADRGDPGEQVRLMSLHAAKGLEFRHVFIIGLEDGTLPHEASLDEGRLEEERRLFYVGITRARERLWLSHSEQAQRYGQRVALPPSRFLDELPASDLQRDGTDPEADAARRAERASAGLDAIRALLGQ